MPADIQFPPICDICRYYYLPTDCLAGVHESPGIGHVCRECGPHARAAATILKAAPGIAAHMIEDGDRNDICPPRFLRRPEEQP